MSSAELLRNRRKIGKNPMFSMNTGKLVHPLIWFGAVPLAREALESGAAARKLQELKAFAATHTTSV